MTEQHVHGQLVDQALDMGRVDVAVLSVKVLEYLAYQESLDKLKRSGL